MYSAAVGAVSSRLLIVSGENAKRCICHSLLDLIECFTGMLHNTCQNANRHHVVRISELLRNIVLTFQTERRHTVASLPTDQGTVSLSCLKLSRKKKHV